MKHLSQHWLWYAAGAGLLWYAWAQKKKADAAIIPVSTTTIDAPPAVSGLLPGYGPGGVVAPGPELVSHALNSVVNDAKINPFVRGLPEARNYARV